MADREAAFADKSLNYRTQLQEAQGVGDDSPALADFGGHFVLFKLELLDQLRITLGFLDGVKIFPLEILYEGEFEDGTVICLSKDHGDLGQAEQLSCPPAAFSSDQFEVIIPFSDNKRLDDTLFADGVSEFAQSFGGKIVSRLERAGADSIESDSLNRLS